MTEVNMSLIKALREKSGAALLDCKKALIATKNDIEASIDWLRKNGYSKAAKKQDRIAAEGLVSYAINESSNGQSGSIVEVNSETDFVARNQLFQDFVSELTQKSLACDSLTALKQVELDSGGRVEEALINLIAKIGENINIRRLVHLSVSKGIISGYVHNAVAKQAGRIGVLVALESEGDQATLKEIGHHIALHIAANAPLSVNEEDIDPAILNREREIYKEQVKLSGKPDHIAERMVEGRIRKFLEESVLEKQKYLMDTAINVRDAIKKVEEKIGSAIKLKGFHRIELGQGIEKQEMDFAEEVASITNE